MDENKNVLELHKEPVPYIVYEEEMARAERRDRRHWILEIILVILLVASNLAWIAYEAQFTDVVTNTETETIEASADGGGNAYGSIVSGDNSEVNYG